MVVKNGGFLRTRCTASITGAVSNNGTLLHDGGNVTYVSSLLNDVAGHAAVVGVLGASFGSVSNFGVLSIQQSTDMVSFLGTVRRHLCPTLCFQTRLAHATSRPAGLRFRDVSPVCVVPCCSLEGADSPWDVRRQRHQCHRLLRCQCRRHGKHHGGKRQPFFNHRKRCQ